MCDTYCSVCCYYYYYYFVWIRSNFIDSVKLQGGNPFLIEEKVNYTFMFLFNFSIWLFLHDYIFNFSFLCIIFSCFMMLLQKRLRIFVLCVQVNHILNINVCCYCKCQIPIVHILSTVNNYQTAEYDVGSVTDHIILLIYNNLVELCMFSNISFFHHWVIIGVLMLAILSLR